MKKQIVYATFNGRLIANIIDCLFFSIILAPVTWVIKKFNGDPYSEYLLPELMKNMQAKPELDFSSRFSLMMNDPAIFNAFVANGGISKTIILDLLTILVSGILISICWCYFKTTPGKILIGIKIVDEKTFGDISPMQSVIRSVGCVLTAASLMIGLVWMLFNPKKQAWHDMMAHTAVIKK
jgi:uncharacterized RDD family membrane protein YckC